MAISGEMTIAEILKAQPKAAEVLRGFGMHCIGCAVASGESLKDAAGAHGVDVDKLIDALNKE